MVFLFCFGYILINKIERRIVSTVEFAVFGFVLIFALDEVMQVGVFTFEKISQI